MHSPHTCNCCHYDHYDESSRYIVAQLENLGDDQLKEKLDPRGGNRSISKLPRNVSIDENEINESIDFFALLMKDVIVDTGLLLRALPIGSKFTDGDPLYEDLDGDWEWNYNDYFYYHTEDEIEINEEIKNRLSLVFLDAFLIYMVESTAELLLRKITIQSWLKNTRKHIRNGMTSKYMFGVGGKNVLDISDINALKKLIKGQWTYFQKFAEEVKNKELTGSKILQRIRMYGEAATQGYEQAKAKSHAIKLPEYPADGNQRCYSNCRCHWELDDDGDYVKAYWRLNPVAEHCDSCVNNSRKWKPLRVKKQ